VFDSLPFKSYIIDLLDFREDTQFNYYCEFIIRYENDVYDYIYGMNIGNEKFDEDLFKTFTNKSRIIFDSINNIYIKKWLNIDILPYFIILNKIKII
jgi:hypothetical protein